MRKKLFATTLRMLIFSSVFIFLLSSTNHDKKSVELIDNIEAPLNSVFYMNELFYIYQIKNSNNLLLINKETREEKYFELNKNDIINFLNSTYRIHDSLFSGERVLLHLLDEFELKEIALINKVIPNNRSFYLNLKCKNLIYTISRDTITYDFNVVLELDENLEYKQFIINENSIPDGYRIEELISVSENELEFYLMEKLSLKTIKRPELYYRATLKLDSVTGMYVFKDFIKITLPEYFIKKKYYYNMTNRVYKDSLFVFMISKDIFFNTNKLEFKSQLDDVFAIFDISRHNNFIHLLGAVDENIGKVKIAKHVDNLNYTMIDDDLSLNFKDDKIIPVLYNNKLYQHPKNCNCISITTIN